MIVVDTRFKGDLSGALAKYHKKIEDGVVLSGVAASARVIYDEVKLNVSGAREHPKIGTGNLDKAIYRSYIEARSSETKKVYRISWDRRIAPHGHLIEFGTAKNPAYPFIRPAFDAKINDAIAAGIARMGEKLHELDGEL
jgi:HK97 gp10 family phage protein